jgi:hypothetical protein
VGESAAKGYPQPRNLSMQSFLEAMLQDAWPDRKVEVISLGTTAVASFPLVSMVREAVRNNVLSTQVLAQAGRVSASEMGGGATDPAKLEALIEQHAQALRALSFLVGGLDLSPADLLDHLRDRIAAGSHDTGLLIVDYLQPWAGALASQANVDMRVAVGKAVMALRDISNVIDAAVLLVSAQNRSGQGSANMTSLRESSDLEYSADSIWFLTSDDAAMVGGGKYARTLTISKNRFGPSGRTIGLVLDGSTQIMTVR